MSFDGKALGEQIVASVREYVSASVLAVSRRMDEVEARVRSLPAPEKGEPGKDASPDQIREVVAAEVEWAVKQLPKPKDGEPGKDAEPIHPDTLALMVAKAVADIPKAKDGEPGRDAADLVILPGIDETRSYPRGTWASHLGGLWKAQTQTQGMDGWQVMVDGVAAVTASGSDEGRQFSVFLKTTSGAVVELPFSVPSMIYRGIWKEGEYERGDCVTRDGSTWHCDAETTIGMPGVSPDWKLAVKRGSHGKDKA